MKVRQWLVLAYREEKDCCMSSLLNTALLPLKRGLVMLAVLAIGILPAPALEPADFPEPPNTVAFNVQKNGKSIPVTLRQLEKLGLYRVTTTSPYEKGQLTFEGVLFRDVLKLVGLEGEDSVALRAVDEYVQIVPREDWTEGPLLLATRQDGKLLTRRTQGPTRLIYPLKDYPAFDTPIRKPRWVWLIKTLESGG
ncbi:MULTISPECIES: molybdopterin-dependent oxidoreductase [unclassified Mesorhizobium]|uniref:molybdopterin-dependent oxidoreductase n=1 Tax=unclassified Mesorhizobium TaxID=325217 RepID=UPI000FD38305|nr:MULTISPECIES: molybdopterin-dependent oxidoreductase [unclassified Mesorhizobium]RUV23416.1 hypothetical protein EOA86_28225 [Mesorhizobium sp. M5C.F.Ca.IN.020.32.2.1]RWG40289.1 MAG: hypothetical protein EOQ62_29870 [Mesorhizobium sp.]RWH49763.1 MAG: hypothetical protein EOQ80_05875 [Mesorhizobium sp.]RWH57102.1 MAG: hypothetical protein EOQ82_10755 [Mesorhizobium sp.]RWI67578.1 MAG: hypothetical protein EOR18_23665 [Mesorhizobium sp.]